MSSRSPLILSTDWNIALGITPSASLFLPSASLFIISYVGAFGSRHAVEVHAWTKIKHLKRKIVSMGISERVFQPRSVRRAARGSLLTVARNSGSVTKMVVHEEGSVRQVKEEAARDAGVSASKVQFIAGGAEMQDDRRLKDYGLTGDAVVWMEVEGEEEGREGGSQSSEAGCCSVCSVM
ncbi:uncharacterized protein LOC119580736 [Penaeus monodon]|uniref:uncharacterized protein LOC119580736 n=1 Tax=Penaeus monodon TaxID=6687 RepID=UPI0018A7B39C|nr:uncharacterized protein LOC119580736 [Penaeus monodon]